MTKRNHLNNCAAELRRVREEISSLKVLEEGLKEQLEGEFGPKDLVLDLPRYVVLKDKCSRSDWDGEKIMAVLGPDKAKEFRKTTHYFKLVVKPKIDGK